MDGQTNDSPARDTVRQTWSGDLRPPDHCPKSADVVVIGGGIVGVSTAWFLARQGVSVVLCEKGFIAGEQSGRNWGWVRQMGRDTRELPMMIESARIWRTLEKDIGESVGLTRGGCFYTARTSAELDAAAQWLPIAREYDLDTRVIKGADFDDLVEGASNNWAGALHTASDSHAEPHKAAPAIARAAERAGARVLTACAVRGLETSGGNVSAVVTEHGTIKTSTVLCAAGAWTSMFCRSLGIAVPQLKVRGTVARTAPAAKFLNGCVYDDRIGIRRRDDGGYTVAHGLILDHAIAPSTFRFAWKFLPALRLEYSKLRIRFGKDFFDEFGTPVHWKLDEVSPFEKTRVLDPEPSKKSLKGLRKHLYKLFPALDGTEIIESWAGTVETTPDVVPIICPVDGLPGFHIGTGFSGHGFGIGPGAGKVIAGMLTNTDVGIDLQDFRLSRFYDGSPIRPMSTI
jgi:glycine/D-amino acid oxidase-like deaminating enzyme